MIAADVGVVRRDLALRGIGIILLSSFFFGVMAVCVRLAAREMPPPQVAWVRFTGSLLVLLAVTRGRGLRPRASNRRALALRGLLGAGAIMLYYIGISGAGAGLATLLHCTHPVFTALFAVSFLGEAFSARIGAALALNLAGVLIVVGPGGNLGPAVLSGAACAIAAAVLAGGAVATARHLRATESAALITTYFMAVGSVATAPSLIAGVPAATPFLALALLGVVVPSVAGQWLLHHGLGFTSATQGGLAAATMVISAAGLEALLLNEHLGSGALLGACLMIVAVVVASAKR